MFLKAAHGDVRGWIGDAPLQPQTTNGSLAMQRTILAMTAAVMLCAYAIASPATDSSPASATAGAALTAGRDKIAMGPTSAAHLPGGDGQSATPSSDRSTQTYAGGQAKAKCKPRS